MKTLLLTILLMPALAWSASMKADSADNPVLDQYSEDGFVDCVLRIVERSETTDHYRLRLRASYAGLPVGLEVLVLKNIQGGFDAAMQLRKANVYRHGVIFRSTGPESDRLISALAALYGRDAKPRHMIAEETFTAIALNQGTLDMEREPVKLKLFGRDGEPFDENAYYESFLNLDLAGGFVYWNEKDPDYREPLLRALSK